jgi:hypothetical protein
MRKSALTFGTNLQTGKLDMRRYYDRIQKAHAERFQSEHAPIRWRDGDNLPAAMPQLATNPAKVHWLLAHEPLPQLDAIYPIVWTDILREKLSALPVAKR